MTSLYYIAPTCFAFLTVPWYFKEYPLLSETWRGGEVTVSEGDVITFTLNCLCAFALNLAVFLLIGKTSALTMNVAGGCQCSTVLYFIVLYWTVLHCAVLCCTAHQEGVRAHHEHRRWMPFTYCIVFIDVLLYSTVQELCLQYSYMHTYTVLCICTTCTVYTV